MRGDFGAGREIGMGMGLTTQSYASSVSITYDDVRNVYVGEMSSRGGVYRVEGPDRGSIDTDMEQIVRDEYAAMTRELVTQKQQNFGADIGRSVIINGHQAHVTRHMESGIPVLVMAASGSGESREHGSGVKDALTVTELSHTIYAMLIGNWFEAIFSALLMAFEDAHAKAGGPKQIFAVQFGGILITAATRALLKKKLLLQKNRRIQIIMHHMRTHDEARDKAENIRHDMSLRILDKKKDAEMKWSTQFSPQGDETGWRSKSLNLRKNLEMKRDRAQSLWATRV